MIEWVRNHRQTSFCIVLVLATFAVYLPVRNHEFVRFDDDVYITQNSNVQSGLSWQNIKWAFTTRQAGNWHPLTWLSHMLDCTLFGQNAGRHHLVNVLFHLANTILLFIVLSRMTKGLFTSAFVAALFALHPLHIESVAWAAERKDVLSTLFWLLTILAYVRYTQRPSAGRYIAAIAFFVLGLLSKPMLVTLPFVLLLLDYWPLERIRNPKSEIRNSGFSILNSLIEKIPFFALSAISSLITFFVQQKGGAMSVIPLGMRIDNAICSYLNYIGKMFWPLRLAVFYPLAPGYFPVARAVIYAVILALVTVLLVYHGRRFKYLLVGWLWYIGTLVPVIGIVQVGSQAMADRYTYIPLIGLFIIIAFGAADLLRNIPFRKSISAALALVILSACVLVTSLQLRFWKNSFLLLDHTMTIVENSSASVFSGLGNPADSAKHLSGAFRDIPNSPIIHNNFANVLKDVGKFDEAIEHYKFALELDPNFDVARRNLASVLVARGDYDEAIKQIKISKGPDVDVAWLHQDLAVYLKTQGKIEDAVIQLKKAIALKPDSAGLLNSIGIALVENGQPAEAVEYYNRVLRIDPNNIFTHGRLALALATLGRTDEAIGHCRVVLNARPNDVEMHINLGLLLQKQGKLDEAVESYKKALQIDPSCKRASDALAALAQQKKRQ
jgi:tetratricopeptide (TPR) repeat protein